jgi:hypothetical protein
VASSRCILAAAAVPLALAVAPATGEAPPVSATDLWSTDAPVTSAGRNYSADFTNPSDTSAKPPALQHVHLQLPAGARFDTDAIPQCHASDPELMAEGAAACSDDTKLGTNKVVFDTGFPGSNRFLNVSIVFFNEHDQLVILAQEEASGARTVVRGTVGSDTLDIDLPPLPGTPPDGAAEKSERAMFLARSTSKGNYLTTPPTCPSSRVWTERVTYSFRDGSAYTATAEIPCRPDAASPGLHRNRGRSHHRHRHRTL